jgi:hypothetical protein
MGLLPMSFALLSESKAVADHDGESAVLEPDELLATVGHAFAVQSAYRIAENPIHCPKIT